VTHYRKDLEGGEVQQEPRAVHLDTASAETAGDRAAPAGSLWPRLQVIETMASTVDDEEYGLKFIAFPPHDPHPGKCPIVLQRHNGPCSFLALTNTLLLTRQITLPVRFTSLVPYSVLADLVASYILARHPEGAELESVLDILPKTRDGLDINPRFDSIAFAQSSQETGEMLLFKLAGVPLVHGFLADPADSETWKALSGITFDEAAMKVAQADELTGGLLLSEDGLDMDRLEQRRAAWSPEQSQQVHDGQLIQSFLQTNSGQLSYRGLFEVRGWQRLDHHLYQR
jgi:hypothetical protein